MRRISIPAVENEQRSKRARQVVVSDEEAAELLAHIPGAVELPLEPTSVSHPAPEPAEAAAAPATQEPTITPQPAAAGEPRPKRTPRAPRKEK
jgi:hypothetical protein